MNLIPFVPDVEMRTRLPVMSPLMDCPASFLRPLTNSTVMPRRFATKSTILITLSVNFISAPLRMRPDVGCSIGLFSSVVLSVASVTSGATPASSAMFCASVIFCSCCSASIASSTPSTSPKNSRRVSNVCSSALFLPMSLSDAFFSAFAVFLRSSATVSMTCLTCAIASSIAPAR